MWDEQKRSRFEQLRQCESVLTEGEQSELSHLIQEIEAAEAAYLAPAAIRLRQQRDTVESQNRTLEVLARRKEDLVSRLRDFLAEAHAERRAIESELAAVMAGSRASQTDE